LDEQLEEPVMISYSPLGVEEANTSHIIEEINKWRMDEVANSVSLLAVVILISRYAATIENKSLIEMDNVFRMGKDVTGVKAWQSGPCDME